MRSLTICLGLGISLAVATASAQLLGQGDPPPVAPAPGAQGLGSPAPGPAAPPAPPRGAQVFQKRTRIRASAEEVFAWHETPDALRTLIPPWESARVLEQSNGIRNGSQVVLEMQIGPFTTHWVARHQDYSRGRRFRDVQVAGPFARWVHTHTFIPDGPNACWLEDRVEYELPMGRLGRWLGAGYARDKLERMFDYRHRITREACEPPPPTLPVIPRWRVGLLGR